ncbi:MAG: 30S ribosomal protein S2 [Micrococcales bacterium]|nr:30S ribosomal protein S2 [Micrococcales bacterium]
MAIVTMRQLLDSGVHFGHQTRRWNPKMKRFILTERNGIYIIDLTQTLSHIDNAYAFIKQTVARGGSVLFVGTKKQAQEAVQEQASRVGMPYVSQRWLGGMLTNFQTISKRLHRLKELEEMNLDEGTGSGFTKKERLMMSRERDKLERTLGGIRTMGKVPAAVWIVDTKKEHLAVDEARKLGIPVVAILDTNADPDDVDYKIPGNDDAIRAVALLTRVMADAVAEGLVERHSAKASDDTEEDAPPAEPLAEWEQELLAVSETEPVSGAVAKAEEAGGALELEPLAQTVAAEAPGLLAPPDAASQATAEDLAQAAAGDVKGVEVTEEAAEQPLAETVAEAVTEPTEPVTPPVEEKANLKGTAPQA